MIRFCGLEVGDWFLDREENLLLKIPDVRTEEDDCWDAVDVKGELHAMDYSEKCRKVAVRFIIQEDV